MFTSGLMFLGLGVTSLNNQTYSNSLNTMGGLNANNVIFTSSVKIFGKLQADRVTFITLTVNGQVEITNGTFSDNVSLIGDLNISTGTFNSQVVSVIGRVKADNTSFEHKLSVCSSDVKLKSSSVKNLVFKPDSSRPVLELENTAIETLIFESGNGLVIKDQHSNIANIVGGEIRTKTRNTL